jgi:hypothetical protein
LYIKKPIVKNRPNKKPHIFVMMPPVAYKIWSNISLDIF